MSDDILSRPPEPSGSEKAPLSKTRRLWRFLCLAVLAVLSCVVMGSVAVICFINTSYGRHFVEKQGAISNRWYGDYRRSFGPLPDENLIGAP